jgi:hypothetical protein
MDFKMDGLKDLQNSLEKAIDKYPDLAEESLEENAKKFKKRVIKITDLAVEKHSGKLIKGFKLDKMRFYGNVMEKDFRGTAPHFHLIENGHEQVTEDGKTIGWVPGFQLVKQARNEWSEELPDLMQKLLDDIVKECGL